MAGGDMHVRAGTVAFGVDAKKPQVIDAHSAKAGDFTETRTVDSKKVWLTAAGAEAYDKILAEGNWRVSADTDPGWIGRKLAAGAGVGNEPEQFIGNPKAK